MRIGYITTGAVNFPASDSGRGLECDKFSARAVDVHFNAFVKRVIDNVKDVAPNAMQYIEIDSYEMGGKIGQNHSPIISRRDSDMISYRFCL